MIFTWEDYEFNPHSILIFVSSFLYFGQEWGRNDWDE